MSEHLPVAPEPQDSQSPRSHDSSAASISGIGAEPLDPPDTPRESAVAQLRVPHRAGGMQQRVTYPDMRLRVTYPNRGKEMPSALVIRDNDDCLWLCILATTFFAFIGWAANGPPPDGDVEAARFLAVLALGSLVAAWRFASTGLRATEQGIVITNFAGRRRIPWADLLDVTFRAVAHSDSHERIGEWLVLLTKRRGAPRAGHLARAIDVPLVQGDAHDPTDPLPCVRTVLPAMRDEYAVSPRARPDIQDS